ncbi:MAG TPA: family 10 glycosylhydrolase, partial [Candidatus Nanopelagicales bacterium]|nr:family 10 glycosylhydrolase [Candidatus Nanopelagicales bacterium]
MRSFLTLALAAALALPITAPAAATTPAQAPANAPANPSTSSQECTPSPRYAKTDFRGMWIASVVNIDWPAKRGQSAQAQQQQLIDWFDLAKSNNFNAVVLQVRPTADTFWPSDK